MPTKAAVLVRTKNKNVNLQDKGYLIMLTSALKDVAENPCPNSYRHIQDIAGKIESIIIKDLQSEKIWHNIKPKKIATS